MVSTWVKQMLPGVQQLMWQTYQRTGAVSLAAEVIGVTPRTVQNWIQARGGVRPSDAAIVGGVDAVVVRGTGSHRGGPGKGGVVPLDRGAARPGAVDDQPGGEGAPWRADGSYSASRAQRLAGEDAARPQPLKLGVDTAYVELRRRVVADLAAGRSPQQISERLMVEAPPPAAGADADPTKQAMTVAAETIYRALFLQARGGLKREVEAVLRARRDAGLTATQAGALRSGRTVRRRYQILCVNAL